MKKIIALALIVCASFSVQVNAQAPQDGAKKEKKEKKPKTDKADKDAAKAAKDAEKAAKKVEKDATKAAKEVKEPKAKGDKKEKANKPEKVEKGTKKVADKDVTVKPEPKNTKKVNASTEKAAVGDDKVVGKDDKGRTIYEGPRGGRYYINSGGNKSYVSQK